MPIRRRGCKSNRRQAFHFEVDLSRARERDGETDETPRVSGSAAGSTCSWNIVACYFKRHDISKRAAGRQWENGERGGKRERKEEKKTIIAKCKAHTPSTILVLLPIKWINRLFWLKCMEFIRELNLSLIVHRYLDEWGTNSLNYECKLSWWKLILEIISFFT